MIPLEESRDWARFDGGTRIAYQGGMPDVTELRKLLESIASDRAREAEWLDLLAQLEYVGARKILKSVPYQQMDEEILLHIAEEASHAHLLKAQAARLGRRGATWPTGKLSAVGWRYFQELDRRISGEIGEFEAPYPVVSWAIERRVMEIYPVYLSVCRDKEIVGVLQAIVAQESRHGKRFDRAILSEDLRRRAVHIEEPLWAELFCALERLLVHDGDSGAPNSPVQL